MAIRINPVFEILQPFSLGCQDASKLDALMKELVLVGGGGGRGHRPAPLGNKIKRSKVEIKKHVKTFKQFWIFKKFYLGWGQGRNWLFS